ncbi:MULTISPECIES: universal stress protein [Cohnella]|uniref:Nucleotide-binding universal stress UspA family protein n=1 Tax=Cohnella phaseoli TaxID=456490 RepID=A0A3D9IJN6_9BACL|nr:universal stress protein [Cohnella phaseoli]RED61962.1 nucleotide-binding universal stress UspA family protein [Cohnella phaseoli]
MIFNHILVPYDGSEPAGRALDKAIQLARKDAGTRLTVAHVINLQPVAIGDMTFTQPESYQEEVKKHGEKIIDSVKQKIGDLSDTDVVILAGSPASAILDYADGSDCDLIIIGSRGLGAFRELMVGSVSHNVILHSGIPVMVMK